MSIAHAYIRRANTVREPFCYFDSYDLLDSFDTLDTFDLYDSLDSFEEIRYV